tara:strand:- start:1972 stop:2520 length:549 start_codon:yes stop_codon:yes gene_type:complete
MMRVLGKLSTYALQIAIGSALTFAGVAGVQTLRLSAEQGAHAKTQKQHEQMVAAAARATADAVMLARVEERRRYAELQGIADETAQALTRARADGAAAVAVSQRLRERITALVSATGRCAGDSAAAEPGTATRTTGDLLADVQRRLDQATDEVARHADDARIAGRACERSYNALSGGQEINR